MAAAATRYRILEGGCYYCKGQHGIYHWTTRRSLAGLYTRAEALEHARALEALGTGAQPKVIPSTGGHALLK